METTTDLVDSPVSIGESPNETLLTNGQIDGQLDDGLLDDELLVEEISIDGMCGVY